MNESGEHVYHSLPKYAQPYVDQERSIVLGDEDNVSTSSKDERTQRDARKAKRSSHRDKRRGRSLFATEIRPPSLFDGIPPAPPNQVAPRLYRSALPEASSRSLFDTSLSAQNVQNDLSTPVLIPVHNDPSAPVLIPVQQVNIRPMVPARPQLTPRKLMPGYVPPHIANSILSQEGSAVKLVPNAKESEDEEYIKACNKACIICCLVIVLLLLIASATAAAVLQLL